MEVPNTKWLDRSAYEADITIIVLLFNGQTTPIPHTVGVYTTEWVEKLYRGIARNYSGTFDFICLSDQNYKFKEPIRSVRLSMSVDQYGWLSLLDMYRPDLCKGYRVTLGLDTIITGYLDDIFNYKPKTKIGLCEDPFYPEVVCNAISIAGPEFCEEFWKLWEWIKDSWLRECQLKLNDHGREIKAPSEMEVLRKYYSDSERLDVKFHNRILSYKKHLEQFVLGDDNPALLQGSSIVYFHGVPKPHQIDSKWIARHWV